MDLLEAVNGDKIKEELEFLKDSFIATNNVLRELLAQVPELSTKSYFAQNIKDKFIKNYKAATEKLACLMLES